MKPRTRIDEVCFSVWLSMALLLSSVSCDGRLGSPAGPARHVVLISLDTTRADHFGFYGHPSVRTPRLDGLAAESVVLDDLVTVVPTTLASHTTLFTGKYPHHHGVPRNGFLVPEENVTLAEVLRDHGFVSAAFAASFALEERFNLYQGFDHYSADFEKWTGEDAVMQNERSAAAVTDDVLGYLDDDGVPEHLFLFVHYFDAHAPYEPPPPYDTMYDPRGRRALPDWKTVAGGCNNLGGARTSAAERMALQYAGEISYMDEHVGRLLDGLRQRGVLDEALVVVTSDHGETFWEHFACFDHGWSTFDTEIRAVGVVRLPGALNAGIRVEHPLSSVDLFPTILDYLGIAAPSGGDGRPLDLRDPAAERPARPRFAQATKPWEEVETDARWRNMLKPRSIIDGRYKLIQVPFAGEQALYDLELDPLEQTNLLQAPTPDVRRTAAQLRSRLEAWAASAAPLPSHFVVSQQDETIQRLKALGYLGGED